MAHAAAWRRSLPRDESHHRFLHVRFHEVCCRLLRVASDFADHDHHFGLRIAIEQIEGIHKIRPDNRVAANSDPLLPLRARMKAMRARYGEVGSKPAGAGL